LRYLQDGSCIARKPPVGLRSPSTAPIQKLRTPRYWPVTSVLLRLFRMDHFEFELAEWVVRERDKSGLAERDILNHIGGSWGLRQFDFSLQTHCTDPLTAEAGDVAAAGSIGTDPLDQSLLSV
jgi:hypothetical protein